MSLSSAVLDALVKAGATRDQLVAAMQADIAERGAVEAERLEKKRKGNRDRQANKRERDSNASSRVTAVTERDVRDTPPKVSPKNNNQTPSSPPVDVSEAEASSHQPRAWALPIGVSLQVWTDFLTNRKRKRLPNTETAWKSFNDDLIRVSALTGIPPPKLIERCTAKGWGAIYDPRDEGNGQSGQQRTNGVGRHQPSDGLSATTRAARDVFGIAASH